MREFNRAMLEKFKNKFKQRLPKNIGHKEKLFPIAEFRLVCGADHPN